MKKLSSWRRVLLLGSSVVCKCLLIILQPPIEKRMFHWLVWCQSVICWMQISCKCFTSTSGGTCGRGSISLSPDHTTTGVRICQNLIINYQEYKYIIIIFCICYNRSKLCLSVGFKVLWADCCLVISWLLLL